MNAEIGSTQFSTKIFILLVTITSFGTPIEAENMVLVHGYKGNNAAWGNFPSYFTNKGYKVYNFDFRNTSTQNITSNSDLLWQYLEDKKLDLSNTVYIGHSMGGLVIREMLRKYDVDFRKLVTLATPNNGVKSTHPPDDALKDMKEGSPFMQQLNSAVGLRKYNENRVLTYSIDLDALVNSNTAIISSSLYLAINCDANALSDNRCYINHKASNFSIQHGIINCTRDNDTCIFDSDGCSINEQKGNLANNTCTRNNVACTIPNSFQAIQTEIHCSIMHIEEARRTVFNFLGNKVQILESGPYLRNASCSFQTDSASVVGWNLPEKSPDTLRMNILTHHQRGYFYNVPAGSLVRGNLSKAKYSLRFYEPQTTTLTRWSNVTFENNYNTSKCVSTIDNQVNITSEWIQGRSRE